MITELNILIWLLLKIHSATVVVYEEKEIICNKKVGCTPGEQQMSVTVLL